MGRWPREKYKSEYTSYHEMKRRLKQEQRPLHEAFVTFDSFMDVLGPKSDKTLTLERMIREGTYSPENVKWGTKQEQANNRRNTRFLTYEGTKHATWVGERLPLTDWARRLDKSPSLLHRRLSDGWSDTETIDGHREKRTDQSLSRMTPRELADFRPWPASNDKAEANYLAYRLSGEAPLEYRARMIAEYTDQKWQELLSLLKEPDDANMRALQQSKLARDILPRKHGVTEKAFLDAYKAWETGKDQLVAARSQLIEWTDAVSGRQKLDPSKAASDEVYRRIRAGKTVELVDDDPDDYL